MTSHIIDPRHNKQMVTTDADHTTMSIVPFMRIYPNKRKVLHPIERPVSVATKARRFLRHGGRYMITILPETSPADPSINAIHLVAVVPGLRPQDIDLYAEATCFNDPGLPQAVDMLVDDSVRVMEQKIRSAA